MEIIRFHVMPDRITALHYSPPFRTSPNQNPLKAFPCVRETETLLPIPNDNSVDVPQVLEFRTGFLNNSPDDSSAGVDVSWEPWDEAKLEEMYFEYSELARRCLYLSDSLNLITQLVSLSEAGKVNASPRISAYSAGDGKSTCSSPSSVKGKPTIENLLYSSRNLYNF